MGDFGGAFGGAGGLDSGTALVWPAEAVHRLASHAASLLAAAQQDVLSGGALPLAGEPAAARLTAPPPEAPGDAGALLELFAHAARSGIDNRAPGFMGYVPSAGLATAAVAQMVAAGFNRFTGVPHLAPALVHMEQALMRWFCALYGMPETAVGTLTGGTSPATLTAVTAARQHALGAAFLDGTAYVTVHTHHCLTKALRIAGFPPTAVRVVPATAQGRMDPAAAVRLITADRGEGRRPFLLAATAGTTAAGVIDPLPELARVAAQEDLWFHVDAAYGGGFQLTDRGRARLAGVEHADSLTLDPPKSWFLPFGTGVLLMRDQAVLHRAFTARSDYMTDLADHALPTYGDLGIELSREFRALGLWLSLHTHGIGAFRDALDGMLDLAAYAHRRIGESPYLEPGPEPDLSICTFRLKDADDNRNREFLERINASGVAYLSGSLLDKAYVLRMVLLNPRLDRDHLDRTLEVISDIAKHLMAR